METTRSTQTPTPQPRFDHMPPAEMHAADLYRHEAVCTPLPGWDALDDRAIEQYHRDGYLAVEGALTADALHGALEGLRSLIDSPPPDFQGLSFEHAVRGQLHELTSQQRQDAVRKLMGFCCAEPRLHAVAHHPRLLDAVSRLMGGRTPKLFQEMALLKPPMIGREKPWHQDHAYFNLPLGTAVVGVWIALDEATPENGCMRVLPGGHRAGPRVHFKRRDWQLCDSHVPRQGVVACPLKPGGLLVFDGLLPHGTPHNRSPHRRRALQFHYAPADVAEWTEEDRLRIFGGEGRGVEC